MKDCNIGIKTSLKINKWMLLVLFALVALCSIPLYEQGVVINNDALKTRSWASTGFMDFLRFSWTESLRLGRVFGYVVRFPSKWIHYLMAQDEYLFIKNILVIGSCLAFGYYVKELFEDKILGLLTAISSLAFMPITFEHNLPNAYMGFSGLFIVIMLSLCFYIKLLRYEKKIHYFLTIVLLVYATSGYEAIYMFFPLYLLTGLYVKKGEYIKNMKYIAVPVIGEAITLILDYVVRIFYPSHYIGNKMSQLNIAASFSVVKQLFLSSLPGYYLINGKYKYLSIIYNNDSIDNIVRCFLISILYLFLVIGIVISLYKNHNSSIDTAEDKKSETREYEIKKNIAVIVGAILMDLAMAVPYAISARYSSGVVNAEDFISLSSTWFASFFIIFIICYLIKLLGSKCWMLAIPLAVIVGFIQYDNGCFAARQKKDFERIQNIERMVASDTLVGSGETTFYAGDMYKTKNALAICDDENGFDYWVEYAKKLGINYVFEREYGDEKGNRIYLSDDAQLRFIWVNDKLCIQSKHDLYEDVPVRFENNKWLNADCTNATYSNNGDICYYFRLEKEELISIGWEEWAE